MIWSNLTSLRTGTERRLPKNMGAAAWTPFKNISGITLSTEHHDASSSMLHTDRSAVLPAHSAVSGGLRRSPVGVCRQILVPQ